MENEVLEGMKEDNGRHHSFLSKGVGGLGQENGDDDGQHGCQKNAGKNLRNEKNSKSRRKAQENSEHLRS